jgi:hypothetical protein
VSSLCRTAAASGSGHSGERWFSTTVETSIPAQPRSCQGRVSEPFRECFNLISSVSCGLLDTVGFGESSGQPGPALPGDLASKTAPAVVLMTADEADLRGIEPS